MTKKKLTYAEKHAASAPENQVSSWMEENHDIWTVAMETHNFEASFMKLPYPRQIALVDLLSNIFHDNIIINPPQMKKAILERSIEHLQKIHWMTGSYYEEGNSFFPISDDEKKLVRMECYGTIDARREHELSSCYRFFSNPKQRLKRFKRTDYHLETSPMWRVFNQFESFRSIAPKVKNYLYMHKIHPDALKVMSVNDFCDVIHKAFTANESDVKARFLKLGYKYRYVIAFMKACGKDLEKHLQQKGYDARSAHSLCRLMSQYGICDVNSLTITELHYNERVLHDLAKAGYDVSNIKVGDAISEKFTNLLFSRGQENLILARNADGSPLEKNNLPQYEVHHTGAVQFARDNGYLARTNYKSKLMLVEKNIHRAYYHGFDNVIRISSGNECYYSRINSLVPSMCMIDGFNSATDMFYYDLEDTAADRKREADDKKCVVNYYSMQFERLSNIVMVAEKHHIEYSQQDLKREKQNLMNLLQIHIDIPTKDAKAIKGWIKPQLRTQNKKGRE